ncbi:hypothetical protein R0P36_003965 [Escherichia coli O4]
MLQSETMSWQPEFTDKTLSGKPGRFSSRIWLVAGITDMRNGFNGLASKVLVSSLRTIG